MMKDKISIEIIRSKRKTIALQIMPNLRVVVKVPFSMRQSDVERFIKNHSEWIEKNQVKMKQRILSESEREKPIPFSEEELHLLTEKAREIIPGRVSYFASILGVTYGKITIRRQVSRWGSCSVKGNLNFNCLLLLCPPEVLDYVVIHELCHLLQLNHSPQFWAEVARICPEYQQSKKWLKENGGQLIVRLRLS